MVGAVQQNRLVEDTNDGREVDNPNVDKDKNVLRAQELTVGNFDDDYLATEPDIYYDESYTYLSRKDLSHFSKGIISGFGRNAHFKPIWWKFWDRTPEWIREQWESARHATCLLYTSPSPRDGLLSRMPSSA